MKLYKAKATTVVYFMSDRDDVHRLRIEAEDHIRDSIKHNGLSTPMVAEVTGQEKLEGDWERDDFVPGSEDLTGDEPLCLKEAMILVEKAAEKGRALPAAKGAR